jgi:hypothetical protein
VRDATWTPVLCSVVGAAGVVCVVKPRMDKLGTNTEQTNRFARCAVGLSAVTCSMLSMHGCKGAHLDMYKLRPTHLSPPCCCTACLRLCHPSTSERHHNCLLTLSSAQASLGATTEALHALREGLRQAQQHGDQTAMLQCTAALTRVLGQTLGLNSWQQCRTGAAGPLALELRNRQEQQQLADLLRWGPSS